MTFLEYYMEEISGIEDVILGAGGGVITGTAIGAAVSRFKGDRRAVEKSLKDLNTSLGSATSQKEKNEVQKKINDLQQKRSELKKRTKRNAKHGALVFGGLGSIRPVGNMIEKAINKHQLKNQ